MSYLPQVVEAHHISGFIVSTRFDDRTEKRIDVSQWFKGPVFEPLKDPKIFKKFFVEGGTLAWPNGVDIAPEALCAARESTKKRHNKKGWSERERRVAHPKVEAVEKAKNRTSGAGSGARLGQTMLRQAGRRWLVRRSTKRNGSCVGPWRKLCCRVPTASGPAVLAPLPPALLSRFPE
jgi:hypothetical protein